MSSITRLETERLLLREWRDDDLAPFAAMNADPVVRRYFPSVLTREQSDESVKRLRAFMERRGWGMWAAELKAERRFVGFIGLNVPEWRDCVEIGWRLAADVHGRGLATEGAREVLRFGHGPLDLEEIVAFVVPANVASRRVMEKLGMTFDPADTFEHPRVEAGHPLRTHLLYRHRRG